MCESGVLRVCPGATQLQWAEGGRPRVRLGALSLLSCRLLAAATGPKELGEFAAAKHGASQRAPGSPGRSARRGPRLARRSPLCLGELSPCPVALDRACWCPGRALPLSRP